MGYMSPCLEVIKLEFDGFVCQSPGGGGSEGTGDDPLFAPPIYDPYNDDPTWF